MWSEVRLIKKIVLLIQVQDKYRYCDSRRQVLLEHVYEGYEKDWWAYNDQ